MTPSGAPSSTARSPGLATRSPSRWRMRARSGCASALAIRASDVSPAGRWPLLDEGDAVLGMVRGQTKPSAARKSENFATQTTRVQYRARAGASSERARARGSGSELVAVGLELALAGLELLRTLARLDAAE